MLSEDKEKLSESNEAKVTTPDKSNVRQKSYNPEKLAKSEEKLGHQEEFDKMKQKLTKIKNPTNEEKAWETLFSSLVISSPKNSKETKKTKNQASMIVRKEVEQPFQNFESVCKTQNSFYS